MGRLGGSAVGRDGKLGKLVKNRRNKHLTYKATARLTSYDYSVLRLVIERF